MVTTDRQSPESPEKRGSGRRFKAPVLITAIVLAAVFFIGFMLSSFLQVRRSSLVAGDPVLSNGIRIIANVVDVAPSDKVVKLRLVFQPLGKFAKNGNFLSQPTNVSVLGGADVVNDSYEAGEIMLPADIRVPLRSGTVSMYPLDRYESTLRLEVTNADGTAVPTTLEVDASNPGYRVQMTDTSPSGNNGTRDLDLQVSRAPTTIFFAIFTSVLMLTLTILALMTVFWLLRGGASESVRFMIPLILVLLFAFPAIRSFAPGVPPLGVLVDFFAFFWCEIALGIGVIVVYANLMREIRKTTREDVSE
jgi:hypothetical protein